MRGLRVGPRTLHRTLRIQYLMWLYKNPVKTLKNRNRITSIAVFGGVTGNRTRDTRIFSPLLYQLSYDTILLCRCSNGIAKVVIFSLPANFSSVFLGIFVFCI